MARPITRHDTPPGAPSLRVRDFSGGRGGSARVEFDVRPVYDFVFSLSQEAGETDDLPAADRRWLSDARAVLRETGLRSVFHHHCAGFVETPAELDRLLKGTDPNVVGLCFDTGHYRFGGGDPVDGFKRFRERIWHVHWKDCSPAVRRQAEDNEWDYFASLAHGIFCELGQGDVDFAGVAAEMHRSKYEGWIVVEQDVVPGMGTPKEYARRNREFLQRCGF